MDIYIRAKRTKAQHTVFSDERMGVMITKTRRNPFVRLAGFLTACLLGLSAIPLQCLTAFAASPAVKPFDYGEVFRDGDYIDFGDSGECFIPNDQEVITEEEGWPYFYGQWSVSYVKYVPGTGQYQFLMQRDPEVYSNYSQTIRITSEDCGTPTGFRIIDGDGVGDCPYVLGVVFAKPFAAGKIYRDGDVIDFGNGVYCKLDDKSTTVHQVSDVLKVRFDNYEEDYGQYWYALTDFEADCYDVCISSDGNGMPIGFEITGGSGTQSDPFTFGLVFAEQEKTIHVGDVFFNGDTIDFGAGAYYRDESGIEVLLSGKWKLVYEGYNPCDDLGDDNSAYYDYMLLSDDRHKSIFLWNERSADSSGITVKSGDGSEEHPYWFDVVFEKPIRAGILYRVGDTINFGTETRCLYDDTDSERAVLSGMYKVSSCEYDEGYGQYHFSLTGNGDASVWLTSENRGTPTGFTVTGGSGTQSDPYTFGLVFAKPVRMGATYKVGDYIDFEDGNWIVDDDSKIDDYYGDKYVFASELSGVWQLKDARYVENRGQYRFTLVNESGSDTVNIRTTSEDFGTPSGMVIVWGEGLDEPFIAKAMPPVKSPQSGGIYWLREAVDFGEGVYCVINQQGTVTKLSGIWYINKGYSSSGDGMCTFELLGGTARCFYLPSGNTRPPVGFRITGGDGSESNPYTFEPVFAEAETVQVGKTYKVGDMIDFVDDVGRDAYCIITGPLELIRGVAKVEEYLGYDSGKYVFRVKELEYGTSHNLRISSENLGTPAGFTVTGGKGLYVHPFTFGVVFDFTTDSVTLTKTSFTCTGKEVKIGSYVRVKCGDTALKYNTDFTLSYENNVNCGVNTASVTVTGIGNYTGSVTKYYSILPKKQAKPALSTALSPNNNWGLHVEWAADANAQGYEVQYCKKSDFTGDTLHSVAYASKTACDLTTYPKLGETWYVRVRSYIKDSAGTKYGFWSDTASTKLIAKVTEVTLTQSTFAYTGREVKIGSYVRVKAGTTALKYGQDFTMSYENNVNCGVCTAKLTITGIGNYTGTVTKYYTIVPVKQAKSTLGTNGGALHVRWAADSNAKGYQVQYCKDASFTGETFHSKAFATKTEYDLSEYPKTGETWYVRVRSYITNSSGTKYGLWSDTASITLGTIDSAALTQTEFAYTGKPVKVGSYIKVKSGTTALKYDVDFTLAYANNVSRGTATVTAVGIGEYAGSSFSMTYKIK